MQRINGLSLFTRILMHHRIFANSPMQVADVGVRGGPQGHWPIYGQDIRVLGFEPYVEESDQLNALAAQGKFHLNFTSFPVGLGNANTTARLYEYANKAANSMTPPVGADVAAPHRDIIIRRFDDFAAEQGIASIDFMKIDVERQETSVIEGLGRFLVPGGILGFEVEVHFRPQGDTPMFSEIEILLRRHGYLVYDVDIFRGSEPHLPSPVAWDHRDHNNNPIFGPTVAGRLAHGDALFFKDLAPEKEKILATGDSMRILKMASLMELYGFPDCAIKLLEEYRAIISPIVSSLDTLYDAFVPHHYGKGLTYKQYLEAYERHVGRVPGPGGVAVPGKA